MTTHTCRWCRTQYTKRRIDQAYCSTLCSTNADKLELKRARRLYRALYHWRYNRKDAGKLLVFICREIRHWIVEDRACQRMPPPKHDLQADRGHQRVRDPMGDRLGVGGFV